MKQKAVVGSAGGSVGSRHKIITTFHENCGLRQTALRHARRAWRAERCFVIPLYKASGPLIGAFNGRSKKTAYCIKPGQENCAGPPRQFLQCCVKREPLRCADNGLTIRLSERIRFVQSISGFSSIALSVWLFVCRSRYSSAVAGANGRSQHKPLSIEKCNVIGVYVRKRINQKRAAPCGVLLLAQTVGFEPTWHCCQIDFESISLRPLRYVCLFSAALPMRQNHLV